MLLHYLQTPLSTCQGSVRLRRPSLRFGARQPVPCVLRAGAGAAGHRHHVVRQQGDTGHRQRTGAPHLSGPSDQHVSSATIAIRFASSRLADLCQPTNPRIRTKQNTHTNRLNCSHTPTHLRTTSSPPFYTHAHTRLTPPRK